MKRPLFSITIPTYNPGHYLEDLLCSLSKNDCSHEMEIIISDDKSTEDVSRVKVSHEYLFHSIVVIYNDKHYGFPRNGRQHGMEVARGEWICNSDQDDYWEPHGFDKLKEYIEKNNPKYYIISDFIEECEDGSRTVRGRNMGWTHGKFYQREFIDKYRIKYGDVRYNEDISLTSVVNCICTRYGIKKYEFNEKIYIWRRRSDSLASIEYFTKSMPDYAKATLGTIIKYVKMNVYDKTTEENFIILFLEAFLNVYFYFQSSILYDKKTALNSTIRIIQPILDKFKKETRFTNENILEFFNTQLMGLYQGVRDIAYKQVPFIEQMTIAEWINSYFE